MHAKAYVIRPCIGRAAKLLSHAVVNYMHIVIYEHGLNVCNNVQPFEPLHLLLIGYLAMHYAVARAKMRHFPPRILYCVKAHFNRPVADGVYYGGHIMAVRAQNERV